VIDHYRTKKTEVDINDVWDLGSDEDILRDMENKEKLEKVSKVFGAIDQ